MIAKKIIQVQGEEKKMLEISIFWINRFWDHRVLL